MNTLFPVQPILPTGFEYYSEFITVPEELQLIEAINKTELRPMIFQGFEAKRKVASFGYDWHFTTRTLSKGTDIPQPFDFVIKKVAAFLLIDHSAVAELLITEYPIGSLINWHRDAPPFDVIIGISLLSDCTLKLRPYDKQKQNRRSLISIPVKRRSMYIMRGPSRSEWEHSTGAVKEVRYSITLRTLK
jgi:alkylated DNA repair dioxygenase AlkB